ncbi:MAG: pseudouridine synthase [bacterium]
MKQTRINKYIADSGYCSRRKADELIKDGQVKINNCTAQLGDTVGPDDVVRVGQHIIDAREHDIFIAFNKPVGVISTFDKDADNSIPDYVDAGERIFNVGRLDVASSGLILLTNNGDIAEKITHPSGKHEKEYLVTVDNKMTRSFIDAMRGGVKIGDYTTEPAQVKKLSDTRFSIILTEGKNRQIRRMCETLGYEVKQLKRIRIMNIKLRDLGDGNWRYLSSKERRELISSL